jgi:hypothetical protein
MKATKYVLAVAMGLALFGTAHAEDWNVTGQFGYFGVGKATELEKGHLYWVGEFGGVFFNDKGKESLFDHAGVKGATWKFTASAAFVVDPWADRSRIGAAVVELL